MDSEPQYDVIAQILSAKVPAHERLIWAPITVREVLVVTSMAMVYQQKH